MGRLKDGAACARLDLEAMLKGERGGDEVVMERSKLVRRCSYILRFSVQKPGNYVLLARIGKGGDSPWVQPSRRFITVLPGPFDTAKSLLIPHTAISSLSKSTLASALQRGSLPGLGSHADDSSCSGRKDEALFYIAGLDPASKKMVSEWPPRSSRMHVTLDGKGTKFQILKLRRGVLPEARVSLLRV